MDVATKNQWVKGSLFCEGAELHSPVIVLKSDLPYTSLSHVTEENRFCQHSSSSERRMR